MSQGMGYKLMNLSINSKFTILFMNSGLAAKFFLELLELLSKRNAKREIMIGNRYHDARMMNVRNFEWFSFSPLNCPTMG